MSFDFNVTESFSDDDEERNAREEGTFLGHHILNGSSYASTKPSGIEKDGANESSDSDSTGERENLANNDGLGFDGYDDYYYDFDEDDRKPSSMDSSSFGTMAFPSDFDKPPDEFKHESNNHDDDDDNNGDDGFDDDEENDDEIDWEDAQEETEGSGSNRPMPLKAVTLDLGKDANEEKSKSFQKKGKKRTRSVSVFKHDKLRGNPRLQSLLSDLHKASLLAWAAHAHGFSAHASQQTNLGLAHSLIPTAWLWTESNPASKTTSSAPVVGIPTQEDIGHFVHWFVSRVGSSSSSSASSTTTTAHNNRSNARIRMTRTGKQMRTNRRRSSSNTTQQYSRQKRNNVSRRDESPRSSVGAFSNYRLADYCQHLSSTLQRDNPFPSQPDNPIRFGDIQTLLLFLSMVRSLGWRARYVVAMEPISRDLDVNHPLFSEPTNRDNNHSSSSNVLARFFGNVRSSAKGKKNTPIAIDDEDDETQDLKPPPAKKLSTESAAKYPASLYSTSSNPMISDNEENNTTNANLGRTANFQHVCWVEILCKTTPKEGRPQTTASSTTSSSTSKTKSPPFAMQWMHVDPISGITNQPSAVEESILDRHNNKQKIELENTIATSSSSTSRRKHNNGSRTNRGRNRRPISYALAVEHLHSHPSHENNRASSSGEAPIVVKMTDVTRRYAASMVATMEARGIVTQKKSSKPKKRKQFRDRMMGLHNDYSKEEERPDHWFAKFLDTMNKRQREDRSRTKGAKKKPPPPPPTREALQSRGNSKEDAIALESDESDVDKKPAAIDVNKHNTDAIASIDHQEESQLQESAEKEPLPTSKAGFKKHPLYVIRSVLNSTEVLAPEAKSRVCGMFKGELVFRRKDVETALSAKRWLYEGRRVKDEELDKPVLRIKARKPPSSKGFKALKSYGVGSLNDGSEESRRRQLLEAEEPVNAKRFESLYGSWQTDTWSPPPVGPGDPIPVNEHSNVELELLNPGLVHIELYRVAKVAKKLGLDYAPCLLGFEGSGKPTIRGIVVHETNEILLREAHAAMEEHLMREEAEKREKAILLRWKRLLVGVLTKDRLEREYGGDE